jgi:hypothetical protein
MSASVVSINPAIEEAFCKAMRVTLAGINNALLHQVSIGVGGSVVAIVLALLRAYLGEHHCAFDSGVLGNLT